MFFQRYRTELDSGIDMQFFFVLVCCDALFPAKSIVSPTPRAEGGTKKGGCPPESLGGTRQK